MKQLIIKTDLVLGRRLEEYWAVYEDPAHKPAHLLHLGQLAPLVGLGVVGLYGAEDGLVLAEPAANVDLALVRDHGAPEPGLVHRRYRSPAVAPRTVPLNLSIKN